MGVSEKKQQVDEEEREANVEASVGRRHWCALLYSPLMVLCMYMYRSYSGGLIAAGGTIEVQTHEQKSTSCNQKTTKPKFTMPNLASHILLDVCLV
jgi:hypothetical protein